MLVRHAPASQAKPSSQGRLIQLPLTHTLTLLLVSHSEVPVAHALQSIAVAQPQPAQLTRVSSMQAPLLQRPSTMLPPLQERPAQTAALF